MSFQASSQVSYPIRHYNKYYAERETLSKKNFMEKEIIAHYILGPAMRNILTTFMHSY
jgi:hypothetical protein